MRSRSFCLITDVVKDKYDGIVFFIVDDLDPDRSLPDEVELLMKS